MREKKQHQIHKSVDNFRFNLRVEENQQPILLLEKNKNYRLQAHDIYYSIYVYGFSLTCNRSVARQPTQ